VNIFECIRNFHWKFQIQPLPVPGTLPADVREFRIRFMYEELDEYQKAANEDDLVGQLDALVDLVYVAVGTAYMQNLPFNDAFAIIHSCNMKKERVRRVEQSKRGSIFDVIKPDGWVGPEAALKTLLFNVTVEP
jgi:predicted HAD superfamily Cof-like phosphohydrolase